MEHRRPSRFVSFDAADEFGRAQRAAPIRINENRVLPMKAKFWAVTLVLGVGLTGCDDLLTETPRDTLTTENFYRTEADAQAAITAAYAMLSNNNLFRTHMKAALISAGDIARVGPLEPNPTIVALSALSWDPQTPRVTRPWTGLYNLVTRANLVLERVPESSIPDATKNRVVAEARFLRAFAYFYLLRLYGDVPLVTNTEEQLGEPARTPRAQVMEQVIADAKASVDGLPLSWNAANKGRAPKAAAQALLTEIYLWRSSVNNTNEWNLAADNAKQIIDSNVYALLPNYIDAFLPGSEFRSEEIFAAQGSALTGAPTIRSASFFYPREMGPGRGAGGWSSMTPLAWHMASYPEGDERFEQSFFTVGFTAGGKRVTFDPHIFKYRPTERPGPEDTNWPIYRLADVLLWYAEAVNELGRSAEAVQYLNMIRDRAGVAPYSGPMSTAAVREAVFQERTWEMAFEGKRWFDLVRRGPDYFLSNLAKDPTAIDAEVTDMLWPIPTFEMDVNPNLTQNPGY